MKYSLLLLLTIVLSSTAAQDLNDQLGLIRRKHHLPGLSFVVVNPQSMLRSACDGYVSLADSMPLTLGAAFHLGSNSKAITSLVAHQLVSQGKISWTTTIAEVFPEWRQKMQAAYRKVTLADLLSHRGRLSAYTDGATASPWYFCNEGPACRQEFSRQILQTKPLDKARKNKYQYSNAGYVVASAMLERRSDNLSFEHMVNLYVNQLLESNFQLGWPRSTGKEGAAVGHFYRDSLFIAADETAYQLGPVYAAAGNLHGTIKEQAALLQFFLQAYSHPTKKMSRADAELLLFGRPDYAFGWGHSLQNGKRKAWHDGSAGTFYTRWIIYPDQLMAIAISSNSAGAPTLAAIKELQALLESSFNL